MPPLIVSRSLRLLGLAAVLAGLELAASARANPPKPPTPEEVKKRLEALQKAELEAKKRITAMQKHELEAYRKAQHEMMKRAEEAARIRVREQLKGQESEALKEAYILLAAANHDYNGHRGHAMHAVAEACRILDIDVLTNGTVQQKIQDMQDNQAAAAARFLSKGDATVHEPQFYSDLQLRLAGILVEEVGLVMIANNQKAVLPHLEGAIEEIKRALATR